VEEENTMDGRRTLAASPEDGDELFTERYPEVDPDITPVLERLSRGRLVDLGAAHFRHFTASDHIPRDAEIDPKRTVADVIRDMLREETAVPLDRYDVHPFPDSTRAALKVLFDHVTRDGKSIAAPLPNWLFWTLKNRAGEPYPFCFFHGATEEQLVNGFESVAGSGDIGALLIGTPTTPLGLTISPDAARRLDKIATKHGITVIVDDVRRGQQPLGRRDSLASSFSRPFVVEGFGHRLGDAEWGSFSYILSPRNAAIVLPEQLKAADNPKTASSLSLALRHASLPALDEIRRRHTRFHEGLRDSGSELTMQFSSTTQTTALATLPARCPIGAAEFALRAWTKHGFLLVIPMYAFYPPNTPYPRRLSKSFRISVGKMPGEAVYDAARRLGKAVTVEGSAKAA
jgi:hypothetical protein